MIAFIAIVFVVLLVMGIPVAFVLGSTTLFSFLQLGQPAFLPMLAQRLFAGMDMYILLAVPLFILAGQVMVGAGLTEGLVRFSDLIVGRFRGGLGHVNVLVSVFFGGISGAPIADAASIGSIMIPAMEDAGYDRDFAAAITAASAVIGAMIPPSILMIIYASVMNISVVAMFAGGVLPGLLVAVLLMALTYYYAAKRGYPRRHDRLTLRQILSVLRHAAIPLLMPIIIIGGILSGVFTPTEAAAVAAAYGFLAGLLMRSLSWKLVWEILTKTVITSSVILLLIAMARMMSWLLTMQMIPQMFATGITSVTTNPYVFLLFTNVLLLVVGMVMDPGVAMIILAPVLAPTAASLGVDPLHFALILTINLIVGLVTPPIGFVLYTTAGIANIPLARLSKALLPFITVELVMVLLVTYIPFFTLYVPKMLGFYG